MANHLHHLLDKWVSQKDELQWVLATITGTEGSSYRKPGAMMLINSLGRYHGLLSGGCLESDIMQQSRRCWDSGKNRLIQYDMREEEDLAWQLGIGCGGLVKILLQPVNAENQYLYLDKLLVAFERNQRCFYQQKIDEDKPHNEIIDEQDFADSYPQTVLIDETFHLIHKLTTPFHLAIFGAGVDAKPMVEIASSLGWQITLVDSRTGYARASEFPHADRIVTESLSECEDKNWLNSIDAAVLMNHNVKMDAEALRLCESSAARIVGMLGPLHRTERVFEHAGLQRAEYGKPFSNPMGLRLGGELPESIALSAISEIHGFLESADARSISGIIKQ